MDLGLSAGPDAADLIKDGSEATFMQDVVEASQTTPVIVDFWAPWCGPCKTLGPLLEDAVKAAKGAFHCLYRRVHPVLLPRWRAINDKPFASGLATS